MPNLCQHLFVPTGAAACAGGRLCPDILQAIQVTLDNSSKDNAADQAKDQAAQLQYLRECLSFASQERDQLLVMNKKLAAMLVQHTRQVAAAAAAGTAAAAATAAAVAAEEGPSEGGLQASCSRAHGAGAAGSGGAGRRAAGLRRSLSYEVSRGQQFLESASRHNVCVCLQVLRVCRHQHANMGHAGMHVDVDTVVL